MRPVLRSTSDTPLLSEEALSILKKRLIPRAMLLTPNLPEARKLTGLPHASPQELATALLEIGAQAVLLKGGHADSDCCSDLFMDASHHFFMESPRMSTRATHGPGAYWLRQPQPHSPWVSPSTSGPNRKNLSKSKSKASDGSRCRKRSTPLSFAL